MNHCDVCDLIFKVSTWVAVGAVFAGVGMGFCYALNRFFGND